MWVDGLYAQAPRSLGRCWTIRLQSQKMGLMVRDESSIQGNSQWRVGAAMEPRVTGVNEWAQRGSGDKL